MRKSFQDKKARQKLRVWQGVWLLPGSKPRAKCHFLQHLQPSGPPWASLSGWELQSSERSRHSHIQEPLSCRLHVHTQARKEPAGSLAAPSTPGSALSAQLAPGTPHSASSRHLGVRFGLARL